MTLQWAPIQNQAKDSNNYIEMAKGFIDSAKDAFNFSQFGVQQSPEDFYSDGDVNKQIGLWETLNQRESELADLKAHYHRERMKWIDEKSQLTSSNPTTVDYRKAHSNNTFSPSDWTKQDSAGIMYKTFRAKGLDHNQSLGLLMNINAENNFGDKYVFGTHQDGDKTAYGALSWQGGREVELLKRLQAEGLYDPSSKQIKQGERALQLQAEYIVDELKSGKQGSYLNFHASDPLEYAKYANKTYVRSNQSSKVLASRERAYKQLQSQRDWNSYLNQNANKQNPINIVEATSEYSNFGKKLPINPP